MNILRALLETSIYSAVIFAAIMIFKKINRGRLSPLLSFALWFLLLARLCLPVTVQSGFHLFSLPGSQQIVQIQNGAAATDYAGRDSATQIATEQTMPVPMASGPMLTSRPLEAASAAEDKSNKTAKQLGIYDLLLLIWAGGAILFTVWTVYVMFSVSKVVKKKSVPAPPEIQKVYFRCKEEMGIHKRLPLLITQDLSSPALITSIAPKILLPLSFIKNAAGMQIELAIRHELTHFKRKDHLVCLLLRILSVVYWFNPVIWFAEKEMVADMEAACDSRIVKTMEKAEKAYYANTILSMFTGKAETPFALGMALPNTKQVAEKRIRGIYMKSKTKNGFKAASLLFALVLVAACFTTACQPAYTVVKTETTAAPQAEHLNETAASAPATVQPSEPAEERYRESKQLSDIVNVDYNALVMQPEGDIPVASMEIRDFTGEDVQKVVDYFFAGRQTYAPWDRTKAEIQADIEALEQYNKELEKDRQAFLSEYEWAPALEQAMIDTNGNYTEAIDQINKEFGYAITEDDFFAYSDKSQFTKSQTKMNDYYIEKDKEELETAPDTIEKLPAATDFADVNLGNVAGVESGVEQLTEEDMIFNVMEVWTNNPDGSISEVYGARQDGGKNSYILYSRKIYTGNTAIYALAVPPVLSIPKEQAQKLAMDAAAAICPEFVLSGISMMPYANIFTEESKDWYYVFNFTRSIDNVPITFDSHGGTGYFDLDTEKPICYEQISVGVDNDGILSLEWRAPYTNIQVTQPNAQIISMQEAKQKFEDSVLKGLAELGYVPSETEKVSQDHVMDTIAIEIDKIQLGLTRIMDAEGNFTLVPTWDFFGEARAYKDGEKQTFNRFGQSMDDQSFGTIHALDGTIINRSNLQNW